MEKNGFIKISGGEIKEYIRENKHLVYSTTGFSGMQMNMFVKSLTKFDLNPDEIELDRKYPVEFQRSEIPLQGYTAKKIREELEALNDISIRSNTPNSGWTRLKPFPKVGEYNNGTIQIWFDGEYLKPLLELKESEGWAVFLVAEMFSLQGRYPKKLFEILSSVKNRNNIREEFEINTLKSILGLENKYKDNPGMFMKKIIYPAVDQINEKTSIDVKVAYKRRRRNVNPAMIIFEVGKAKKVTETIEKLEEQTTSNKASETSEFLRLTQDEKKLHLYFKSKHPDPHDRPMGCYKQLLNHYGFTAQQAFNAANNPKTRALFFKWQRAGNFEEGVRFGEITKENARKSFFKAIKDTKDESMRI